MSLVIKASTYIMERQPFLFKYPREIARLFGTGYLNAPDGTRWNISFTPGIRGSWRAFTNCLDTAFTGFDESLRWGWNGFVECVDFSWKTLKWGWKPRGYINILKNCRDASREVSKSSLNLIKTIPDGVAEGTDNISKLFNDAPFGWLPRLVKNCLWNCSIVPIIKLFMGAAGCLLLTPGVLVIGSLVGSACRFLTGNIGCGLGLICSLLSITLGIVMSLLFLLIGGIFSLFPLIGGSIVSTAVAVGGITNRFPKQSDSGSYGLHIVIQP